MKAVVWLLLTINNNNNKPLEFHTEMAYKNLYRQSKFFYNTHPKNIQENAQQK